MVRYDQNAIAGSRKNKLMDDVARYKQYADNSFELGRRLLEFCNKGNWGTNTTGKSQCHKMFEYMNEISGKLSGGYLDTNLVNKAINYNTSLDRNAFAKNISKVYDDCLGELRRILTLTHSDENQNGSELEHYGRLGMKWGMHIFGEEKTYRKSMDKLSKIDRKTRKAANIAGKYYGKGDVLRTQSELAINPIKKRRKLKQANRAYKKLNKAVTKNVKYNKKARKLVDAMNKEFANKTISSFSDDDISLGKKYSVELINRSRNFSVNSSTGNTIQTSWGETAIVDFRRDK